MEVCLNIKLCVPKLFLVTVTLDDCWCSTYFIIGNNIQYKQTEFVKYLVHYSYTIISRHVVTPCSVSVTLKSLVVKYRIPLYQVLTGRISGTLLARGLGHPFTLEVRNHLRIWMNHLLISGRGYRNNRIILHWRFFWMFPRKTIMVGFKMKCSGISVPSFGFTEGMYWMLQHLMSLSLWWLPNT